MKRKVEIQIEISSNEGKHGNPVVDKAFDLVYAELKFG